MQIHHEELSDVTRYIDNKRHLTLEDHRATFEAYIRRIGQFKMVDRSTKLLEIGIGTGWFPIMCKAQGLSCKGLEISPSWWSTPARSGEDMESSLTSKLGILKHTTSA